LTLPSPESVGNYGARGISDALAAMVFVLRFICGISSWAIRASGMYAA
jgi:hypothetical protein